MINSDVYWAVVLYHRSWSWFDRGEQLLMAERGGQFDGPSVRRIAAHYSVRRGLKLIEKPEAALSRDEQEDIKARNAGALAAILNNFMGEWDGGSLACSNLADRMRPRTHDLQLSAASKFAWFMNPVGWTMFDDRAATGLKVSKSPKRFERFYEKLELLHFGDTVAKAQWQLSQFGFEVMQAGRVIDSYLLLRASDHIESDREIARGYLAAIEASIGDRLRLAAQAISTAIHGDRIIEESL